jgi:hypothetical protein
MNPLYKCDDAMTQTVVNKRTYNKRNYSKLVVLQRLKIVDIGKAKKTRALAVCERYHG